MPYLYAAAGQAHASGAPMMRAMVLEFPEDPACDYLDRQYMLGDSLLVAPIFTPDGLVDYYLPAGRWYDWYLNASVDAHAWEIAAFRNAGFTGELQLVMPANRLSHRLRQADIVRNHLAVTCGSNLPQGEPHFEGTEAA